MVSTCSMILHPHTIMLSFSKSAPYDGHSKEISFTLSHHYALMLFKDSFYLYGNTIQPWNHAQDQTKCSVTGRREGRSKTDPNQPSSALGGLSAHLELVLKAENQSRWRL